MVHPSGAGYYNKPKWLDRLKMTEDNNSAGDMGNPAKPVKDAPAPPVAPPSEPRVTEGQ